MKHATYHTVDDIIVVNIRGPWITKSGGELNVLFALPQDQLEQFLDFDNPEFNTFSTNVRGLRSYIVSNISKGSIGAMEWHKARTEYLGALDGEALLECVDLNGGTRQFILDSSTSVIVPCSILHTYTALKDNTRLQVIANTLFDPEDETTHDSYTLESFYDQVRIRSK